MIVEYCHNCKAYSKVDDYCADCARRVMEGACATTPSAFDRQEGGSHYKDMPIQPVQFIHANGIPFLDANVIKYVCRHRAKNGKQDLLKARQYIDMILELEYPNA